MVAAVWPLQGPATHHPGLVVGEVTNINDPNQMGRVKVRFPGLDTTQESAWGRLLTPGGGASRGSVMIPEVGDEVLVAFEHGDPRQPIILGGLFGTSRPSRTGRSRTARSLRRRFTSRLGHVWELSDGDQDTDQYFMVQLAGQQHTLKMDKQATNLEIPSGQPLTIKAGDTQVEFSSSGDVTIKGANVTSGRPKPQALRDADQRFGRYAAADARPEPGQPEGRSVAIGGRGLGRPKGRYCADQLRTASHA